MSGDITGYRDLVVWQKAMSLVEDIYRLTCNFPSAERFGLTSQIQRAAVSIPSNIAEGKDHWTGQFFNNFQAYVLRRPKFFWTPPIHLVPIILGRLFCRICTQVMYLKSCPKLRWCWYNFQRQEICE